MKLQARPTKGADVDPGAAVGLPRASVAALLAPVAVAFAAPLLMWGCYGYAARPEGIEPGHPLLVAVLACLPGVFAALAAGRRLQADRDALAVACATVVVPPSPGPAPLRRDASMAGPMPGFAGKAGFAPVAGAAGVGALARPGTEANAVAERPLHAHRMEALGTLASGIVHDFGNVLQVMEGTVSEILEEAHNPAAVERSAKLLQDVIGSSRGGVRRLLSFAREDRLQTTECDVFATLSGTAEVLQRALPKRISIRRDIPQDLPRMNVDAGRLEAMLLNITTNAHHAMPDGGVLTISARLHRITEAGTPAAGLRLGRYVRIDVADTGSGMSAATLARAAEPFFTTKVAGEGTGLGLYSTRSFAEQSGGAFAITSTPGHGTTVTLWLPCVAEPQAALPGAARNQAPRVLLLDDEPTIRDVLSRQLRKRGLQIDVCENAAAALAAITGPQQVDLLLTDFAMPDLSCDTLIARVHVARPGLPVIVLTGFPLDANALVEAYSGTGLLTLLCKPISAREIDETVRKMLETEPCERSAQAG